MYIHISGWHTFDFGYVSSIIVGEWHWWHSGTMWCRFWCRLSESLWWRCTSAFAPPASLGILCCAILARKTAVHLIFPKHSQVSFHRSLHIFVPSNLNSSHLLFTDFRPRFPDQELRFLYCGTWKPSFGHFVHIQGNKHVRLFLPYPTSLPCHSCRQVENLQEMCCCIYISDWAITSTIDASVASSEPGKAWFIHSRRFVSLISSTTIPAKTTSWFLISRTVQTNASVDHGGFPLQAAINLTRSSQVTPAVCYMISWQLSTWRWPNSHPMACYFSFMLLPVLRTILIWVSRIIFSVAAFAASQGAKWCLCCGGVSARGCMGWSAHHSAQFWSTITLLRCSWSHDLLLWKWRDDDNEKKWEVMRKMITKRSWKSWGIYS